MKNLFAKYLVAATFIAGPASTAASGPLPNWWQPTNETPGVSLTVKVESRETVKTTSGLRKVVVIKLVPNDYPKDKRYELWGSWLGGNTDRILELRVDDAGELRTFFRKHNKPGGRLRDMSMRLGAFAKGEALQYALVSTDRNVKVFAKIIPFPLEDKQGSCRLWLELVTKDGNTFSAQGEGFEPGEIVATVSLSNGEILKNELTVTSEGLLPGVLLFPSSNSRKHRASYSVTGRNCTVSVDYEWGSPALKKQ